MRHARISHGGLLALLPGLMISAGCTHNYYYSDNPCGPAPAAVVPGSVQYGSVCEVPTQVEGGSTVVSRAPGLTTPIIGAARPPRVVLSEPSGGSRFAWRRSDPEGSLATTRVEGAVQDPSLTR